MQVWHVADVPPNDKFQYTHFAHKINSFDTAPKKLLASDSRLRPDRYALELGDLSKSGTEKSRFITISFVPFLSTCAQHIVELCLRDVHIKFCSSLTCSMLYFYKYSICRNNLAEVGCSSLWMGWGFW
jgi:hypothetical protein